MRSGSTLLALAVAAGAIVGCRSAEDLELKPEDRPVRAVRAVNMLARLTPGQEARVHNRWQGCFGGGDRVLTFRRSARSLEAEVGPDTARDQRPGASRRRLTLSEAQIAALDRELDYHRAPMPVVCTTRDEFDVVVLEQGREVRRERFVDESCSQPPDFAGRSAFYALTNADGHWPVSRPVP